MLYASEAREITRKRIEANKKELFTLVRNGLSLFSAYINDAACYGNNEVIVNADEILAVVKTSWNFTRKEVLNAAARVLNEYGYTTEIPTSYSSIHIKW